MPCHTTRRRRKTATGLFFSTSSVPCFSSSIHRKSKIRKGAQMPSDYTPETSSSFFRSYKKRTGQLFHNYSSLFLSFFLSSFLIFFFLFFSQLMKSPLSQHFNMLMMEKIYQHGNSADDMMKKCKMKKIEIPH